MSDVVKQAIRERTEYDPCPQSAMSAYLEGAGEATGAIEGATGVGWDLMVTITRV